MRILILCLLVASCSSKKVIIRVDTCENIEQSITICNKVTI